MNDNILSNNQIHWAKYILVGSVFGLVLSLVTLFIVALMSTQGMGMTNMSCMAYGCTLTMLLSQPAGVVGSLIGAGFGALFGLIIYTIHKVEGK
jgi:hypothetical protein